MATSPCIAGCQSMHGIAPGGCLWLVVYIPTWESGIVCLLENAFGQEADLGHRIKIQLKRLEPTGLQSGRFQALRGALRTHQPHPPSLLPGHRCCSSNFAQSVLSCKVLACQNHISTLRKEDCGSQDASHSTCTQHLHNREILLHELLM